MASLERSVESFWFAKQSAKGTPASTATKLGNKVDGDLTINRDDGQEDTSDGARFSNTATFTNTLTGGGSPGLQAQPGVFGLLAYLMLGSESTSGTATNEVETVTITGTPTGGNFRLLYDGGDGVPLSTADIAYNATAATVQAALEAIARIGPGNVTVTGSAGGPYTVTFVNELGAAPQVNLTSTNTFTGGSSPNVTIAETTPGVAVTHTITPGSSSFYTTFWKTLGASVVQRQKFNDCRISALALVAGRNQMVARATPTILSLDPGEVVASDQSQAADVDRPLLYTEVEGTVKLNGTVFKGTAGLSVTFTDDLNPWYGDSAHPHDLVSGRGQVSGENITILVDAAGLALYNQMYYGTPTPAAGTKPLTVPPAPGAFEFNMWRFNSAAAPGRQIKGVFPNVLWNPPDSPAGDPGGGPAEITFGFRTRKVGATPHATITVKSADAAY